MINRCQAMLSFLMTYLTFKRMVNLAKGTLTAVYNFLDQFDVPFTCHIGPVLILINTTVCTIVYSIPCRNSNLFEYI